MKMLVAYSTFVLVASLCVTPTLHAQRREALRLGVVPQPVVVPRDSTPSGSKATRVLVGVGVGAVVGGIVGGLSARGGETGTSLDAVATGASVAAGALLGALVGGLVGALWH